MKKFMNKRNLIIFVVLVVLGVLGRLLPHAWNFTPLIAITIFAGIYLGRKYIFLVPVATMIISDLIIGFYSPQIMIAVYLSFIFAGLIGYKFARNRKLNNVVLSALASSTLFFLITNGAVWLFGSMYTLNLAGLIQSYIAGIPFYRNMMLGDVTYTVALFGLYELSLICLKKYSMRKTLLKPNLNLKV